MQTHRRMGLATTLASTVVVALAAAGAGSVWSQTAILRPPASSLGANARLGAMGSPATSPASSPVTGNPRTGTSAMQNMPTMLQATTPVQVPPSPSPPLAPRAYGATPAQPQTANAPNGANVHQSKLPQRTHCLPDILSTGLGKDGTTVTLICNVPDQPVKMVFHFQTDQQLQSVRAADKSGFSLQIDFVDQTPPAEGNPPQRLVIVGAQEAYQSRVHVVCLPLGNRNELHVGPRSGQPYPQLTTFCTDGQRVTPVTFASDQTSWSFLLSAVEDGPLAIDYHLVMGGRQPKTGVVLPYPIQRISKLPPFPPPGNWLYDTKHPGDPALAGMAARCVPSNLGGAGAAGCFGNTLPVKVNGVTQSQKSSSTEYRAFFSAAIARAQQVNVPHGYTKSVNYTLMPGVVPPEFRAATQGACRVALYSAVEVKLVPQAVGVGHASREPHPKDSYCRSTFGNSTAIWGFSMIRQEEMCFSSPQALEADHKVVADKNAAQQPHVETKSPTPALDTCELLPR